jgi:hypothetical protein
MAIMSLTAAHTVAAGPPQQGPITEGPGRETRYTMATRASLAYKTEHAQATGADAN